MFLNNWMKIKMLIYSVDVFQEIHSLYVLVHDDSDDDRRETLPRD